MRGRISGSKMYIELDTNFERLDAGNGQHWIPCSNCGVMIKVADGVVSAMCSFLCDLEDPTDDAWKAATG